MAKGIAVLSPTDGSVVHKLMNDGNAIVGGGGSESAVEIKGKVHVEGLAIKTKVVDGTLITSDDGSANDNLAQVVNAIENTMDKEIVDSRTRRDVVDGKVTDLITAAGLTAGTTDGAPGVEGLDPTLSFTGDYISGETTLKAADNKLQQEASDMDDEIDDFLGISAGETDKTQVAINNVINGAPETLNTIASIQASINDESSFLANTVSDIADAIDELDGVTGQTMEGIDDTETVLEQERLRRKGNTADSDVVTAGETGQGTQGRLQWEIDQIQAAAGLTAAGAPVAPSGTGAAYMNAASSLALRDNELDAAIKTLEDRIDTLETQLFDTHTLTLMGVNATTTMNGHMKMAIGSQFNFPVLTVADLQAEPLLETEANNGMIFYLDIDESSEAAPAAHFADGARLYFCENGKWHSSYNLNDKE